MSAEALTVILVGNQRGGAKDLAVHLLKEENDHVEVHELRGFVARDLRGAFNEAYAVSRGTRCRQYLFSVSFNPPSTAIVSTGTFEAAIARVEKDLGLTGQPRAIVFHEKAGRRHAHCVWSRIRADDMKAVQLSYSHRKLMLIARELHLEHSWKMPRGLAQTKASDPSNFTLAQWQQAKRNAQDPRTIKTAIQDAWAISDTKAALTRALAERGYRLARGDSRAFVVVDRHGEIYSLPRWAGVKTKDVRARLGDGDNLPDVASTKAQIAKEMQAVLARLKGQLLLDLRHSNQELRSEQQGMRAHHRIARQVLSQTMEARRWEEARIRQSRFRVGIKGMWDWVRGENQRIRLRNEAEASAAVQRDRIEKDALIIAQLAECRQATDLRQEIARAFTEKAGDLRRDRYAYSHLVGAVQETAERRRRQRF
ncbi:relaxase [Mesorhizobium sp. AD1-1]|uniref:relaxase/mobilization nuclease domain-containing protein n=1 Tax=Mesorhizobium sp. AD1-1 TaxID=2876621 RepID=UPI001CCCFAF4|nr:relaxase [Mesorhizobium sp. AD1-1]MBZ9717054.1 relaxase [Mesorhizobium sp. AD1-1]